MSDSDDSEEYDEEVSYVIMDVGSDCKADVIASMAKANGGARITDLEADTVYFQAGPYFFVGALDETVGLFPLLNSMKYNNEENQKLAHIKTTFKCKTTRVLMMDRIEIANQETQNGEKSIEHMDIDQQNEGPQFDGLGNALLTEDN
ncbi:hypothetical protein PHYBLDRAFT_143087 [Phycomyces blakesleeanus NRRL 1555(-)]|uniref:Transcription factor TFIIIC triple barrel domain-containing protein n=1 Tax=Phycomyces blakesleeanus (strain ATCC 8743b / DSM 1359 / FGSC 10004 / NBRC 33097 / NRRL 1555) TaxID=763407 RepID=A0A162UGM8_PHYB8|nr:hypothetical protein PHYBLDRAFT_143087 [Phycomyces blakesleeanus NRRL 1555(-)]OAD76102.1 hypothetical protein PHYBLDRAFT_143087 [Phycomyces blakesleeanus NRRL 1555(-)]|eukprot:XP_018294142.1 hypothetical protein PHYBLDRAFT_143087 [Phycomyces blakesleeanus NRRL 1555(-)]